jgi:hypothetical protein
MMKSTIAMGLIGFACLFIAACAGQDTDSAQASSVGSIDEAVLSCPNTCNDSGCRLADGSCTIACNSCLCKRRGGTPDNRCLTEADVIDDRGDVTDLIVVGQQCGAVVCGKGTHCCNASCGKCVPPGVECTQQTCD